MTTLTYTGELVVTSCWCGIHVAIPDDLYKEARRNHQKNVYCPLGHSFVYGGDTEAQKLKRQLEWATDTLASERARADGAEASLRTTKGHVTRLRKQVLAGECPICGQHLRDLARHVNRMHPEEDPENHGQS
jgi:DNA repair exonuclease SbcCD ATPase subunit